MIASLAEQRQPFGLGRGGVTVAIFGREQLPDRLQIFAGVKASGNFADILAERLAVPDVHRAGERIDLRAGVVDIIFLGDAEAGRFEQPGEASPTTAPRQWPMCNGPVGLAETYSTLTRSLPADGREAIGLAFARMVSSSSRQASSVSLRLMKPGPAISTEVTGGSASSFGLIASASARGLVPAALASTIAALIARSPWRDRAAARR